MSGHTTLISLVIPCFNEEESLPTLFERLDQLRRTIDKQRYRLELVIVDDGSNDATWSLLRSRFGSDPTIHLLHHDRNLGFGRALKTGLQTASGEFIVTIDADTNYDLRETPALLECLKDGADVVTASPFMKGGGWKYPLHRLVLSRGVTALYRLVLGRTAGDIATFTCGFRAYRREALPDILPASDDFLATAEMLVRALMRRRPVVQMPTTVHRRMYGRSKLRLGKTIRSHAGFLWTLWRTRGAPHGVR